MNRLLLLLLTLLVSQTTVAKETNDLWPSALYKTLSYTAIEAAKNKGGEVWRGGTGIDESTNKRVGLVIWSDAALSSPSRGLVVSCFEDTNTDLPEIVVYQPGLLVSKPLVSASYRYDKKPEQQALWAIVDKKNGGMYVKDDGDAHVRSMIGGRWFFVNAPRAGKETYGKFSLAGFTREFTKACDWHPNYNTWLDKGSSIESTIQAIAEREYPDDKKMQRYVYKKQLAAYKYLHTVKDTESLEFARVAYPEDFAMRKYTYDKQSSAKRYIGSVKDKELKAFSARAYPQDYAMQKYTYDKQLSAKVYMNSVDNPNAKAKAVRQYPKDYSMQKYIYDKLAF